jgi:hypothetical protein
MRFDLSSSEQARPEPAVPALQRMLGQSTELLQRDVPPLVDAALQRVDDALYEFADKAESDRSYAIYFEAQRRLRHERANLKRRFLRNLTDTVALFQDAAHMLDLAQEHSFDSEDLELLGDKDLEESLVLTNMISKAETRYLRALHDLARHFANLLGRPTVRQRDLPIGPTAIANAFAAALRAVEDLDLSTILVVYKIFDQQVMDRLDGFYTACVAFAHTQGLRPTTRKHQIIKADDGPRATAAVAGGMLSSGAGTMPTAGAGGSTGPTWSDALDAPPARLGLGGGERPFGTGTAAPDAQAQVNIGASVFDALRRMLAGTRQATPGGADIATLTTVDLIEVLSRVQPEAAHRAADAALPPSVLRETVGARLRASMEPGSPRRLEPTDEDTMDLVFLMFEQILAGGDMPDPIKVLVSRLQIPYVKVALMDRDLFDDAAHPARRLLNRIGAASIGWNDCDRDHDGGLYALIEHIVERIVTELHTEPGLFHQLDRELAEHTATAEQHFAAAEQRIVRQAAARNIRQAARRQAQALLDARADDIVATPPIVRTILTEGWLEAMMQAHAAGGEQDRQWRLGERVLSDLLWSVSPKTDAAARRELLRRIPELLRDLRSCLTAAIPDQQLLARWLKELQTVHIAALRGQAEAEPAPGARAPLRAAIPGAQLDDGDADALPIGCWLGLTRDDGSLHRVKLAWRGDAGDPLVFVDRLGQKGFELPRPELEALLAQDLAVVIGTGDLPVVDRAIEAVRQSLRVH